MLKLHKNVFDIKAYFCKTFDQGSFDLVPKEQKSGAIYSIPRNDCNQEYIGQTKRQFGTRLKEHQQAVSISKKDNSA